MTKLFMVLGLLAFTGCASFAPYSYEEHCALQGMKLAGVTDSSSSAMATGFGQPTVWGYGNGTSVSCKAAETPQDKCEVSRWQNVASPKIEYNSTVNTKQWINGAADFLIVPGIVAEVIYDGQKSDAINRSMELHRSLPQCNGEGRIPGSISTIRVE